MWRATPNDVLQDSYLAASSGLLTPPTAYTIDARRHSTASTLSLHGPTTPVYGRSPFSEHSHGSISIVDEDQERSPETLAMAYPYKTHGSGHTSFGNWSTVANASALDCSMRAHDSFAPNSGLLQAHMAAIPGVAESISAALISSESSSFTGLPYPSFQDDDVQASHSIINAQPSQPMWSYQYAMEHMVTPATMTPSLLGGGYVAIDNDVDMSSYDDADVPFAPSPQDVILGQDEHVISEDERRIKRSIHVSSTGGKTVKRSRDGAVSKSRVMRSKRSPDFHRNGVDVILDNLDDVELEENTGRMRRKGGSSRSGFLCSKLTADNKPCNRPFQRLEHLHRHEKTHSGRKDYQCQICMRPFNRNDNCWEHYWTHVHRPGKKAGRNKKYSLRRVLGYLSDPKHIEKLLKKWLFEVKSPYNPETDPWILEDPESDDESAVKPEARSLSPLDVKEKFTIRCKL